MNEPIIKKNIQNTDLQKEWISQEIDIVDMSNVCFTFLNSILFYFYYTADPSDKYDPPITITTGKTPYVMLLNRT